MTATKQTAPARRHPPTDARRPMVAADTLRAAAAARAACSVRPLPKAVSLASCVDEIAKVLNSVDRGENHDVIADTLVRHVRNSARVEAEEIADVIRRHHRTSIFDGAPHSWHRAQNLLTGRRRRKVTFDELDQTLRTAKGDLARQVRTAVNLYQLSLDTTTLRERIVEAASQQIPVTDVEAAVTALIDEGVDGEKLCWAVITRETQRHIGLIWKRANKLAGSFPQVVAEDLFGFGWAGLRIALRKYDPETAAFSTYAAYRIDGEIRDRVRGENPIPKRLGTWARKVTSTEETLLGELGRAPTLSELAARLDVPVEDLNILPRLGSAASIEELTDTTRDLPEHPVLSCGDNSSEDALRAEMCRAVREALTKIDPVDAEAVRLLDLEQMSLTDAETVTGASARQLRQRRQRGRAALAGVLDSWRTHTT